MEKLFIFEDQQTVSCTFRLHNPPKFTVNASRVRLTRPTPIVFDGDIGLIEGQNHHSFMPGSFDNVRTLLTVTIDQSKTTSTSSKSNFRILIGPIC